MQIISSVPLDDQELKILNRFLCSAFEECHPMNVTEAHGFFVPFYQRPI